mmetsp:Transcript_15898/g.47265  ORF Transcript_15898/g.47265 Transcript_15898/m.47265 type:complete len:236 (-) Transcript_15898:142-849(-)
METKTRKRSHIRDSRSHATRSSTLSLTSTPPPLSLATSAAPTASTRRRHVRHTSKRTGHVCLLTAGLVVRDAAHHRPQARVTCVALNAWRRNVPAGRTVAVRHPQPPVVADDVHVEEEGGRKDVVAHETSNLVRGVAVHQTATCVLLHDERAGEARRRVVQLPPNIPGQLPRSLPGAGKNARIGARHGLCSDTLGGELAQLGIPASAPPLHSPPLRAVTAAGISGDTLPHPWRGS